MDRTKQRILILDDDSYWAKDVKGVVTKDGHWGDITTSPPRAIALARNNHYDILVLDLGLRTGDPQAAVKAYYAIREIIQDIKLIVMSGTEQLIRELNAFIERESIGLVTKIPLSPVVSEWAQKRLASVASALTNAQFSSTTSALAKAQLSSIAGALAEIQRNQNDAGRLSWIPALRTFIAGIALGLQSVMGPAGSYVDNTYPEPPAVQSASATLGALGDRFLPGPVMPDEIASGRTSGQDQVSGSISTGVNEDESAARKDIIIRRIRYAFTIGLLVALSAILVLYLMMFSFGNPLHRFISGLGATALSSETLYLVYWYTKKKPY